MDDKSASEQFGVDFFPGIGQCSSRGWVDVRGAVMSEREPPGYPSLVLDGRQMRAPGRRWRRVLLGMTIVLPVLALACVILVGLSSGSSDEFGPVTLLRTIEGNGSATQVQQLLVSGADPNKEHSETGLTPILAATRRGDIEVVQLLLRYSADVQRSDEAGWTPLMGAAISDASSVALVQLLLDHGADPCAELHRYEVPETALSLAEAHHSPAAALLTAASKRC